MPQVTAHFDHGTLDDLFDGLDVVARVGYTADYAPYVEFPTEYTGSPPPFEPLHEWVVRKWNDLDDGLKDLADGDTIAERQRQVAWIVQASIGDSGTDGVYFLNRGFEAAKQASRQFLEAYEDSNDPEAARKSFVDTVDFAFEISQDIIADEASDRGTLLQSGYVVVEQSGAIVHEDTGES